MFSRRRGRRRREDFFDLIAERLFGRGPGGEACQDYETCESRQSKGEYAPSRRHCLNSLLLRQFRQNRFVQANAGVHVFERKILIRRMRPAIRKCETKQKRLDPENGAKL